MCLHTKQTEPTHAKRDIVCYKVLLKFDPNTEKYISPYKLFEYELNKLNNGELILHKYPDRLNVVETGFHSFENIFGAIDEKVHWSANVVRIVKCIIPAGSYYYKGYYEGHISYASNAIAVVEELTNDKINLLKKQYTLFTQFKSFFSKIKQLFKCHVS